MAAFMLHLKRPEKRRSGRDRRGFGILRQQRGDNLPRRLHAGFGEGAEQMAHRLALNPAAHDPASRSAGLDA
jgi:hypothetical protein